VALLGRELIEQVSNSGPKRLLAACACFAQERLELGNELLDWIEIRAVGRQIQQARSDASDRLLNARHLVSGKVVEHDHITLREGRSQHLLDIGPKDLASEEPHAPND
jgi:hypothetical protein